MWKNHFGQSENFYVWKCIWKFWFAHCRVKNQNSRRTKCDLSLLQKLFFPPVLLWHKPKKNTSPFVFFFFKFCYFQPYYWTYQNMTQEILDEFVSFRSFQILSRPRINWFWNVPRVNGQRTVVFCKNCQEKYWKLCIWVPYI